MKIKLTEGDAEVISSLLDSPREPNDRMKDAMHIHTAMTSDSNQKPTVESILARAEELPPNEFYYLYVRVCQSLEPDPEALVAKLLEEEGRSPDEEIGIPLIAALRAQQDGGNLDRLEEAISAFRRLVRGVTTLSETQLGSEQGIEAFFESLESDGEVIVTRGERSFRLKLEENSEP